MSGQRNGSPRYWRARSQSVSPSRTVWLWVEVSWRGGRGGAGGQRDRAQPRPAERALHRDLPEGTDFSTVQGEPEQIQRQGWQGLRVYRLTRLADNALYGLTPKRRTDGPRQAVDAAPRQSGWQLPTARCSPGLAGECPQSLRAEWPDAAARGIQRRAARSAPLARLRTAGRRPRRRAPRGNPRTTDPCPWAPGREPRHLVRRRDTTPTRRSCRSAG